MSSSSPATKDASAKTSEDASSKSTALLSSVAAKRRLRREVMRSTKPAETILAFQKDHSLHTMMARAFGTTPRHEMKKTRSQDQQIQEPLDSDSAITFLSHLGVPQYDVHKRITDTLMKQLEAEIRKSNSTEALLRLLQSCWKIATASPEMRPVLWAVLKQLGEATPLPVLAALTERDQDGKLKHAEIFEPLPPLLKRLCWEADWESRISSGDMDGKTIADYQSTLLFQTIEPLINQYCDDKILVDTADRMFVSTVRERKVPTKQRRALTSTTAATASSGERSGSDALESGKTIAQIRSFLCDTVGAASSFRPKLLYALFSILIAQHGDQSKVDFGGSGQLRCSLVADILLSAGGPLPKVYQHLVALARNLDECVQEGNLSDFALKRVQESLKLIFLSDDDTTSSTTPSVDASLGSSKPKVADELSLAALRQLNKIIIAGIEALKEADPQSLFLNPVTDAIAPGYSKIISKPMCIMQMETKVSKNKYTSIDDWEKDVKLMYKNCVDYNKGPTGQWFRGEAARQGKVFREEILSQARKLYQTEVAKRSFVNDSAELKRKLDTEEVGIEPLPASTRKRKKGAKDEHTPSMPALASMLLADPFVVRIIVARVLRDLRHGVINGTTIPAAHYGAPSLLQILYLARWSKHICAVSGKRYLIPDCGMRKLSEDNDPSNAPFTTLRRLLPLLLRLILEAELDRRVSLGGDLHAAAQSTLVDVDAIPEEMWIAGEQVEVPLTLLQGALVFLCQPGLGNEASLAKTLPKFAAGLRNLAPTLCDDHSFFFCLSSTILRHKAKLPKVTRDSLVQVWLEWLENDKRGSVCTSAHEHLIRLLNSWSAFGNSLLPRDTLLQFALKAVRAVDSTIPNNGHGTVANMWNVRNASPFSSIKEQYERMLKQLPQNQADEWISQVGITIEVNDADEMMTDPSPPKDADIVLDES